MLIFYVKLRRLFALASVGSTARWSPGANARQHHPVRAYLLGHQATNKEARLILANQSEVLHQTAAEATKPAIPEQK